VELNIELNRHNIKNVRVYDLNGRQLSEQKCNSPRATIDGSNMPTGVYIMEVVDERGQTNAQKIIKQ
jgi:hypothetical protein